jgi:hypothetical protein
MIKKFLKQLDEVEDTVRSRFRTDIGRVIIGILLMVLLFYPFGIEQGHVELAANLRIVMYVTAFCIATALITHITRRILFPYIDLKVYARKALETPMASAVVFLGICLIISVTVWSAVSFFK